MKSIMKKGKILFTIMFAFVMMFTIGMFNVKAAPDSIQVQRYKTLEDLVNNRQYGFVIFKTNDGSKFIYCIDSDKLGLRTGHVATLAGDGDDGLLYLLLNGYPNEITGNPEIDMYITQAAVWWYMGETGQSGSFDSEKANATTKNDSMNLVRDYIKPMVAKAKAYKDTQVKPSINVSASNTVMSLTSDGKYYESAYMTANLTGAKTYNVELSGATKNTVVVDESGNIGTTMNSDEKFKVRVPVSEITGKMSISVKYSASGTIKKAKIYKPAESTYQRVAGLFDDTVSVSKNVSLTLTPKNVCSLVDGKYYGKSGNEVDKKTYILECKHVCEFTDNKYYGKDGEEVDKKTFNKQCNASCEYVDGEYHGKDGSVVDKKTFEKQCKHVCEVVNDKYYGSNGDEVDESTYNKECGQEISVPNTSANIIFWTVGLGILAIASGVGVIVYRINKNPVKKA